MSGSVVIGWRVGRHGHPEASSPGARAVATPADTVAQDAGVPAQPVGLLLPCQEIIIRGEVGEDVGVLRLHLATSLKWK